MKPKSDGSRGPPHAHNGGDETRKNGPDAITVACLCAAATRFVLRETPALLSIVDSIAGMRCVHGAAWRNGKNRDQVPQQAIQSKL